jgi:hypothetical protein
MLSCLLIFHLLPSYLGCTFRVWWIELLGWWKGWRSRHTSRSAFLKERKRTPAATVKAKSCVTIRVQKPYCKKCTCHSIKSISIFNWFYFIIGKEWWRIISFILIWLSKLIYNQTMCQNYCMYYKIFFRKITYYVTGVQIKSLSR